MDMEISVINKKITDYINTVEFVRNCCFQPLVLSIGDICETNCECKVNKIIHYIEDQGFNACFDKTSQTINAFIYDTSILKH